MNQLEQLRRYTTVVADTGNFLELKQFAPTDSTTNPSLILKAARLPEYAPVLRRALDAGARTDLGAVVDRVLVQFGLEILKIVPGRVSTEVDARLSHDTPATIERARRIVAQYQAAGIPRERVLIKIASTWEGIAAARVLQAEGIQCNLTLLFAPVQADAAAAAGVRLISPFVGRVYDWYKAQAGAAWNEAANAGVNDPGVKLVSGIYRSFKERGVRTEIMGASFRNVGQVLALAGCDLLTISPDLLRQLEESRDAAPRVLPLAETYARMAGGGGPNQAGFGTALAADPMASAKLGEGIAAFCKDTVALEELLKSL
ncbi:MAG: transaldolase [Steroidobacteraceae bacterium]